MLTSSWNDFTNNFASDLAPLVALFGEQVTKQFLSESTSVWDSIIFGTAPLGILTAVVSIIRIYGDPALKAFVGRSQESHGIAEAELCSSTSEDVCEMWSNGGICRVFGRPKILELIFERFVGNGGQGEGEDQWFYPKYSVSQDGELVMDGTSYHCGLRRPKDAFGNLRPSPKHRRSSIFSVGLPEGKRNEEKTAHAPESLSGHLAETPESKEEDLGLESPSTSKYWNEIGTSSHAGKFAPHPNLSLNIGIKPTPRRFIILLTLFGLLLQGSFYGYATWATFYHDVFYEPEEPGEKAKRPDISFFYLSIIGTTFVVVGMTMCARLIDQKSRERRFERLKPGADVLVWLQPGGQRIGDQMFSKFAFSADSDYYITSWKDNTEQSSRTRWTVRVAVLLAMLGWVCQFIGLRGLHGTIALYQFVATIIMSIIRSLLRSRRLSWDRNKLKDFDREVEGHELDWQAFSFEGLETPEKMRWHIKDVFDMAPGSNRNEPPSTEQGQKDGTVWGPAHRIGGFYETEGGETTASVVERALKQVREHEHAGSNKGARLMHLRARLAHLTSPPLQPAEQAWNTEVRSMAAKLGDAFESSVHYIFEHVMPGPWKVSSAICWLVSDWPIQGDLDDTNHGLYLHMRRANGRWKIDRGPLEAILGLWLFSIKLDLTLNPSLDPALKNNTATALPVFRQKSIIVKTCEAQHMKSLLRVWVTGAQPIYQDRADARVEVPIVCSNLSVPSRIALEQPKIALKPSPNVALRPEGSEQVKNRGLTSLSMDSRSDPLQLLAQDIFTMLMTRIAEVIDPLCDASLSLAESSFFSSSTNLINPHIEALVRILSTTGVASREDALMSIVPSLKPKLPELNQVAGGLLQEAKSLAREAKFKEAEHQFDSLFYLVPDSVKYEAVHGLGELYRIAASSGERPEHEFGIQGLKSLKLKYKHEAIAGDVLSRYEDTGSYLENHVSAVPLHREACTELQNITNKSAAMRESLILSVKYDLTRACASRPDLVKTIIHWAVDRNLPELLEDLRVIDRNIIRWSDPETKAPIIFWAIESAEKSPEAFQCLVEWPGMDTEQISSAGETPLAFAAKIGCDLAVDELIKKGASLVTRNKSGLTPLRLARNGDYEEIMEKLLLAAKTKRISAYDLDAHAALTDSLAKRSFQVAALLMDNGTEAEAEKFEEILESIYSDDGKSLPLIKGQLEVLVRAGFDPNLQLKINPHSGASRPFFGTIGAMAAFNNQSAVLQYLFGEKDGDRLANVNLQIRNGYYGTALVAAVQSGNVETVKWLVEQGKADVDLQVQHGYYGSALIAAVLSDNVETVTWLVEQGKADVDLQAQHGYYGSALIAAVLSDNVETVTWLVEQGKADVDLQVQHGDYGSALVAAAANSGSVEVVKYLVEKGGANVNLKVQHGDYGSALVAAAEGSNQDIVQWLVLDGKANVNQQCETGYYGCALEAILLYFPPADESVIDMAKWLRQKGNANVDLEHQCGDYGSPLIAAIGRKDVEYAKWLIEEANATVDLQTHHGIHGTALACLALDQELFPKLIGSMKEAIVNLPIDHGSFGSALIAATTAEGSEVFYRLIKDGKADVDLEVPGGEYGNAVTAAAACGRLEKLRYLLLECKAKLVHRNRYGQCGSALAAAAYRGHADCVEFLLEMGADMNFKVGYTKFDTAVDAAKKWLDPSHGDNKELGGIFNWKISRANKDRILGLFGVERER